MHVVAPFSFSVFWFFTPITTLQVWVMEACQAKKRPGSSVFVKQFGVEWPFTLAFRSGLHWAGWHRRKAPFRALCLHMLVIHGCITMGTAGWELRTQWKIITINKSRSWTGGTSEKSCRFHRSFSLKPLKLRSSCTSVKVRSFFSLQALSVVTGFFAVVFLKQRHLLRHNLAPLWCQWSQAVYWAEDQAQ